MTVAITVLVEDVAEEGLRPEHGLSLWIEAGGLRILFDTGQGRTLPGNARRLGARIEDTDLLVLSHGHYDHTGGVAGVLEIAPGARLILHPGALIPRYSVRAGRPPRMIGMPTPSRAAIEGARSGRIDRAVRPLRLAPGIGVTGPVPRETDYEDTGGPFFLDPEGARPDPIEDDMALWIETPEGLIVCAGCSHAGLINTLHRVRSVSGMRALRAVIGGFHLLQADDRRLAMTVDALRALSPGALLPCHCTGEKAVRAMTAALGGGVSRCRTGMRFRFK
ncbi:MAG: MBL fold metallo-hydrolase [bacterium]|nr:MBL fold metallo-hydrolase [bacterium]